MSVTVSVGGICGAVHVGQLTQGAGTRLGPASAPANVMLGTKQATEMPSPGAPLLLVLHMKQGRTQHLS